MKSTFFNNSINAFARKFLVIGNEPPVKEILNYQYIYNQLKASLCEQILLYDKIAIKVYGENLPFVILTNEFGIKGMEELLEKDIIQFVHWTPLITYNVDEVPGIMPLQTGTLTTKAHSDPEESILSSFNWFKETIPRKIRRNLTRKAVKKYIQPKNILQQKSATLIYDAYEMNYLASFGLPNTKKITKLNKLERAKLGKFANSVLTSLTMSDFNFISTDEDNSNKIIMESLDSINHSLNLTENLHKLLTLENLPDIQELFLEGHIDFKSIIKLRNKGVVKKFRDWLLLASINPEHDIVSEYLDSISNRKGLFQTGKGKFLKTVSFVTVGLGIGTLIGGIPGAAVGSGLGKAIDLAADFGLGAIDNYFFSNLMSGWHPRLFMNVLRKQLFNSI